VVLGGGFCGLGTGEAGGGQEGRARGNQREMRLFD